MHSRRADRGHLRRSFVRPDFRRLYATRLAGQFGDGVFQAALAASVLFNPEHQANAADIASGFAVILLPYSVIGPFAGVLLDRWWRQRVLVVANLLRALAVVGVAAEIAVGVHGQPFYASALVVFSISRFFLSALSAALPHTVDPGELVTANALSTTSGAIAAALGGGGAIVVKSLAASTDAGYAVIALAAAVAYVVSGLVARGFEREQLGPDAVERSRRETAAEVARGLAAGGRHILERRPVLYALSAIGAHRFCYGVNVVCLLLLYRNYFHDDGIFRSGLAGLGQVAALVAVGSGLAAVVTPAASRRFGFVRWAATLFVTSAVFEVGLGLPYRAPLLLLASGVLGFCAQGVKICVDTLVQQSVEDDFRGRVFSLYDTLFNVMFVGAALATALLLPDDGRSPVSVLVLGAVYAATGLIYLRTDRLPAPQRGDTPPQPWLRGQES